jgi:type IX secretion system PorP/SprF family membrane protein
MKKIVKLVAIAAIMLGANGNVQAQVDPHFSQYYVYPSWLNAGLTGVFDGDYRVSGIYRSQWGNVSSPFTTAGISVDFAGNNTLNLGGSLLRQTAGDGGYTYTTGYFNAAYTGLRFGTMGYQRIVFGMQVGLIDRRFNPSKMTWGDQWNPTSGSANNPTGQGFNRTSASSFDAGVGVMYYNAQPGRKTNFFGGVGFSHLTRPEDKFSNSTTVSRLPVRTTFSAGLRINVNNQLSITPNALYLMQGTARETMLGAYAQVKAAPATDLLVGANYRFNDALVPYVGFNHKNITLGISYDINTSDLSQLARGSNAFEISLTYIGRKKLKTPEVEFICPRL